MIDADFAAQFSQIANQLAGQTKVIATLQEERDQYKKLYMQALEKCRKLELGLIGQKRERFEGNDKQLTLSIIGLTQAGIAPSAPQSSVLQAQPPPEAPPPKPRAKPTGRKLPPESLPRVEVEVIPPEVQQKGLEAFERIGQDVCETVERRAASLVVVRCVRGKFVLKDKSVLLESAVQQSEPMSLPIGRALAGPGLLADTIVKRWRDHLPLHRLERTYAREGWEISRSTSGNWHQQLAALCKPLIDAMWQDALSAPYLCTDATGVLVQALERCRNAHFFVVAAPEKHVLFGYTPKHDKQAIDRLIGHYKGYLVADAHAVYDHLYKSGDVIECGCWSHARRYFFKSLDSDPVRAEQALKIIGQLFRLEKQNTKVSDKDRLQARKTLAVPILKTFFAWCDEQAPHLLEHTPIAKAVGYARNQREALARFVEDARLPIHNNFSERALRREAVGRKNWLFLGSDEGGHTNATFVSLLASCQLHSIEPGAYLRDLFCLLPDWPDKRVLELAPAYWNKTLATDRAQQALSDNVFRQVSLGLLRPQSQVA